MLTLNLFLIHSIYSSSFSNPLLSNLFQPSLYTSFIMRMSLAPVAVLSVFALSAMAAPSVKPGTHCTYDHSVQPPKAHCVTYDRSGKEVYAPLLLITKRCLTTSLLVRLTSPPAPPSRRKIRGPLAFTAGMTTVLRLPSKNARSTTRTERWCKSFERT